MCSETVTLWQVSTLCLSKNVIKLEITIPFLRHNKDPSLLKDLGVGCRESKIDSSSATDGVVILKRNVKRPLHPLPPPHLPKKKIMCMKCNFRSHPWHQQTDCLRWGDGITDSMSCWRENSCVPYMDDHGVCRLPEQKSYAVFVPKRPERRYRMGRGIQRHAATGPYQRHWASWRDQVLPSARLQ